MRFRVLEKQGRTDIYLQLLTLLGPPYLNKGVTLNIF